MARFLIANHVYNARQSLRTNRMRTFLTMLGITIGVASITTILALTGGAAQIVSHQVAALGNNLVLVRPGIMNSNPLSGIADTTVSHQNFATSTLTQSDLSKITSLPHVRAAAPLMILSGSISGTHPAPSGTPIVATTPSLKQVDNLKVSTGQFLDTTIDQNTVVIGPTLANELFDTDEPLGQTMTIRGTDFTIIGILATTQAPLNYNNVDFDSAVLINQSMASTISGGAAQIQQINIEADTAKNVSSVMHEVNKTLLASHLGDRDFSVLSGDQISRPTSQLFFAIAGITVAIAAISLLVGGIGIMNIMLVGVAERTREIGIRKAVGAKNSDIAGQFLVESLALSIGGGILGYILGYGIAFAIGTILPFNPIFNWEIGLVAFVVSVFVGMVFGVYPAVRASKKDPIISLRYFG